MGRPKKERTVEAATGKGTFQQLLAQTKAELQDTEQKRVKLNFSVCVNNEITIAQRIATNYGRDKIFISTLLSKPLYLSLSLAKSQYISATKTKWASHIQTSHSKK